MKHTTNLMDRQPSKPPEPLIEKLLDNVPKGFMPKGQHPKIVFTDSVFHSFAYLFNKEGISNWKNDEQTLKFYEQKKVWAFSSLGLANSTIMLSLNVGIANQNELTNPIEVVFYHELGHCFQASRGILPVGTFDVECEKFANIYAIACIIKYMEAGNCGYYRDYGHAWAKKYVYATKYLKGGLYKRAVGVYNEMGIL